MTETNNSPKMSEPQALIADYSLDTYLRKLSTAEGKDYNKLLAKIATHKSFKPMKGEKDIWWTGEGHNSKEEDMSNLISTARIAVELGNVVYIMPNPKGIRTMDYIFLIKRKKVYHAYDLKTITGKASVGNRLRESIGQTRRVLLRMQTDYDPNRLAKEIKTYFERNSEAVEVLIYKRKRPISVAREDTEVKNFETSFVKVWTQKK